MAFYWKKKKINNNVVVKYYNIWPIENPSRNWSLTAAISMNINDAGYLHN